MSLSRTQRRVRFPLEPPVRLKDRRCRKVEDKFRTPLHTVGGGGKSLAGTTGISPVAISIRRIHHQGCNLKQNAVGVQHKRSGRGQSPVGTTGSSLKGGWAVR